MGYRSPSKINDLHQLVVVSNQIGTSFGRLFFSASEAKGRGFDPRQPRQFCMADQTWPARRVCASRVAAIIRSVGLGAWPIKRPDGHMGLKAVARSRKNLKFDGSAFGAVGDALDINER